MNEALSGGDTIKPVYIGAPACFALEVACQYLMRAFPGDGGCYLVGSALERADWRDVDVRLILPDDEYAALFPNAGNRSEFDPRWLLLTISISAWMSRETGLPIDFQFQQETAANATFTGRRAALGQTFEPEVTP